MQIPNAIRRLGYEDGAGKHAILPLRAPPLGLPSGQDIEIFHRELSDNNNGQVKIRILLNFIHYRQYNGYFLC